MLAPYVRRKEPNVTGLIQFQTRDWPDGAGRLWYIIGLDKSGNLWRGDITDEGFPTMKVTWQRLNEEMLAPKE
jgi:hypothetical protein